MPLSSRAAGLIRPEWVNAYGKFPRASPCRPQVIRITQHLLESESGYHQPPVLAKHSTSQNVHVQKTLSSLTSCRVDKGCPSLTTSACRPSWKSSVGRWVRRAVREARAADLHGLQESDLRDLSHLRPVIQEIHVPARHLVYEIHSNARALDAGVFQRIQSAAAIEARFTLQILVIESHLFLKKSFELGHGSFQEGVLTDEL